MLKVLRLRAAAPFADETLLDPQFLPHLIESANSAAHRAEINLLLTRALVRLSREVVAGKVAPTLEFLDGSLAPSPVSDAVLLEQALSAPSLIAHLTALEPRNPIYTSLRDGLRSYQEAWAFHPAVVVPTGKVLQAGDRGSEVDKLYRRLGLVRTAGQRFDEHLEATLGEFQEVHGLAVTGKADHDTLVALNRGSAHYEAVIAANLERARWLPSDMGQRFVLVNTAAAQLLAYEDGQPALKMKAVVGTADRPTPALADRIEAIVVNPDWNVPPHLVQSAIAPRVLQEGLGYLEQHGFVVLSDWSDKPIEADPAKVDWQAVSDGRDFARLRQKAGPANPMGEIKFMFPNRHGIYLHDTPNQELFDERSRYFSNGCVRIEDPMALADFLTSRTAMPQHQTAKQREIVLEEGVPVYTGHFTVWADDTGLTFQPDVYQKDHALLDRLGYQPTRDARWIANPIPARATSSPAYSSLLRAGGT